MDNFITVTRFLTAIGAPLVALGMCILTLIRTNQERGGKPEEGQHCLQCGESRRGDLGKFTYSENKGNPRQIAIQSQLRPDSEKVIGSETHFICDRCTRRFLRNEMLQIVLMVLPYPLYLYVILPLLADAGIFANFLIETFLVILVLAGTTAAYDLFRSARDGETSLAEARDRVAINERKNELGKKYTYTTRMGKTRLRR